MPLAVLDPAGRHFREALLTKLEVLLLLVVLRLEGLKDRQLLV